MLVPAVMAAPRSTTPMARWQPPRTSAQPHARVRVYRFGEHLDARAGTGQLARVPCTHDADIDTIKALCVRAVYNAEVDLANLRYSHVHLQLLPDGEVIERADLLAASDKVLVSFGETPFIGDLTSSDEVQAYAAAGQALMNMGRLAGLTMIDEALADEVLAADALAREFTGLSRCTTDPLQELLAEAEAYLNSGSHTSRTTVSRAIPAATPRVSSRPNADQVDIAQSPRVEEAVQQAEESAVKAAVADVGAEAAPIALMARHRKVFKTPVHAKVKRAVNKLLLIRRFNANSLAALVSGTGTDMDTTDASGNAKRAVRTRQQRIGKMMDAYIREQSNLYQYVEVRDAVMDPDDKLPWYILRPDGFFHMVWDITILVLVLYSALVVPVRIGFDMPASVEEQRFDYFSDVVFIFDIVACFMTTYKENGVFVRNRSAIAWKYALSWFVMDVFATFPVHWITDNLSDSSSISSINRVLRLLRLFKLFRILRLLKLFPKVVALLETSVKINPAALRFMRSFLLLLMMWHLMGCAYWFIVLSQYNGTHPCPAVQGRPARTCFVNHCLCDVDLTRDITRVTVLPGTDTSFYDPDNFDVWLPSPVLANDAFMQQYGAAVFWAVMATTSIGQNIVPRDMTETYFSIVMILFGLMMYSIVIGAASSALANLDGDAAQRRQMLDRVLAYMRSRHVPRFFQKIVIDYYQHLWSSSSMSDDVLMDLPPVLRSRLAMIVNRDLIERVPVFQLMTVDVYLQTVERLERATYMPGEFIIQQGDVGDTLYFIKTGKVDAVLPNGVTVFLTLQPGDFFGEHSLLYLARRDASFRAVDFVDALLLSQADFTQLYISAPDFVREIQRADQLRQAARLKCELLIAQTGEQHVPATSNEAEPGGMPSEPAGKPRELTWQTAALHGTLAAALRTMSCIQRAVFCAPWRRRVAPQSVDSKNDDAAASAVRPRTSRAADVAAAAIRRRTPRSGVGGEDDEHC